MTPETALARLQSDWEARARTPERDFFVASHPGWHDESVYLAQARRDQDTLLTGFDRQHLATGDVLEIGCGAGRLAREIAAQCRSYSGYDIAASMIQAARERCTHHHNARFALAAGDRIPRRLSDRDYDLIVAWAVFIHMPRALIERVIADARHLLKPGGELRFQVHARLDDSTGIADYAAPEPADDMAREHVTAISDAPELSREARVLAADDHYIGYAFGHAELCESLASLGWSDFDVHRFDPRFMYVVARAV